MSLAPSSSDRSVDALWDEMQRESTVSGRRPAVDISRLLNKSMANHASKKNRTRQTRDVKKPSDCANRTQPAVAAVSIQTRPDNPSLMTDVPSTLVATEPFSLHKELNRLADERPAVRKQAALVLEKHLLGSFPHASDQSTSNSAPISDISFSDIAKPLFKRFNDPIEKVRDVCLRLTIQFVAMEQDLLRVLPYLMPAISNRIHSQWSYDETNQVFTRDAFLHDAFKRGRVFVAESDVTRLQPHEPSEEIRLLFVELLATLLRTAFARNASSILHAYVFDILMVLVSGIHDDFHEVNMRTCAVLQDLCANMVSVMKHFTIAFVRACPRLLMHRLARVRVAGIDCVRALVACPNFEKCKGSGTEAIVDLIGHRDDNVIPIAAFYSGDVRLNYFARLDQDGNPQVRRAFYALIQDWILHLPDRYDHESRLMPYLLSAVSSELPEISRDAMDTLDELGKRYEQEHGEEVLEMKQYDVDGKKTSNYNYTSPLPAPFFENRPSLGTRLYVRGRARRFLNPILRELANWQSPTRAQAVRLLKCVIVYSEETITVDAHVLLQTLLKTWDVEGAESRSQFQEIATLIGRFVAPKTYVPLLVARIRGDEDAVGSVLSPDAVGSALKLLRCVVSGSLDKVVLPHVQEIVDVLCGTSVQGFETARIKCVQAQLVLDMASLLQRRGRDAVSAFFLEHGRLTSLDRVLEQLFELAVGLMEEPGITVDLAASSLVVLQQIHASSSREQLIDSHFDACFARAATFLQLLSELQWTNRTPQQVIVEHLLHHTSTAFLQSNAKRMEMIQSHFHAMLHRRGASMTESARTVQYQGMVQSLGKRLGLSMQQDADGVGDTLVALLSMGPQEPTTAAANATAA